MGAWGPIGFNSLNREVVTMPVGNDVELLTYDAQGNLASLLYRNSIADRMRSVSDAVGRITGRPTAVIKNDGKVKVSVRATDGYIYTNGQFVVDGPFTG